MKQEYQELLQQASDLSTKSLLLECLGVINTFFVVHAVLNLSFGLMAMISCWVVYAIAKSAVQLDMQLRMVRSRLLEMRESGADKG